MATKKLSKGAAELLTSLELPQDAATIGYARREWIVYVLDLRHTAAVQRRLEGFKHHGMPVRVVALGRVYAAAQ